MKKPIPIITIEQLNCCDKHILMTMDIRRLEIHAKTLTPADFPHRHDFYNLIYIKSGSGTHDIDFRHYEVVPNQLFMMNEGQVHEWELSDDIEGYSFFFRKEFYETDEQSLALNALPFFNNSPNDEPMVIFDEVQGKVIVNLFEEIIQEYSAKRSNYEAYIKTILKQILIQALRVYQPNYKDETSILSISKIKHFETLIEEYYLTYKSVKDYANQLNITANYLNAICNKIVGRTAGELIRDRIVLEAKRLLLHSSMSICEIAYHLGYEDCSYFIRVFKKDVHQTPDQFRVLHR